MKIVLIPVLLLILSSIPLSSAVHVIPIREGKWDHTPEVCVQFGEESKKYQWHIITGLKEWKLKFREYFGNDNFDYIINIKNDSRCEILVYFEDSGYQDLHRTTGKEYGLTSCTDVENVRKICDIEIFIGSTPLKYLQSTATHELGHAWGFEHMKVEDPKAFAWLIESKDLMIKDAAPFQRITVSDLQSFEAIYKTDGFGGLNDYTIEKFYPTFH